MRSTNILLAAASLAVAMAAGASTANAAPWDRHDSPVIRHEMVRHHLHHRLIHRHRVVEIERLHHYR